MPAPRLVAALAVLAAVALGCGGSSKPADPAPSPGAALDPDVPAWRGGCFLEGPSGKVVNGTPSPDVRIYGAACAGGTGGLVYLDRYDPVAGTGDVTILPSTAGARPIVVAAEGGAGGIVPGSAGARLDDGHARLATLRTVSFVTGELVVAALGAPSTAPLRVAAGVRVENYDFLPSGQLLFVGNYDANARTGDLLLWSSGTPRLLARGLSRAEFLVYRLSPSRTKVAYLTGWTETGGGNLYIHDLAAAPASQVFIEQGVERAAWSAAGDLVWSVRRADGSADVRVLTAGGARRTALAGVRSWAAGGGVLAGVSGWSLLSGAGALARLPLAGGAPEPLPQAAALEFGISDAGTLAWVTPGADRRAGALQVAPAGGAARTVDDEVAPRAGFWFSPASTFVAYGRRWQDPAPSGSASPLPGSGAIRVVRLAGGAPVEIADGGVLQHVDWDPQERWVAALSAYDAAANAGRLRVVDPSTGAVAFSAERVAPTWFGFGVDGAAVAALGGWDDALQRGTLLVQRTADLAAPPQAVSADVTSFARPVGGRVLYEVRGGGRDGIWLH